jgi:NADH-quinone oxidoreductase subunit N
VDSLLQNLTSIQEDLPLVLPELVLVILLLSVVLVDLIFKDKPKIIALIVAVGLLLELYLVTQQYLDIQKPISGFSNLILVDGLAAFWKMIFSVATLLTLAISTRRINKERTAEYHALIISILIGANLLAMSSNFLMVFLSIELISIPSYIIASFAFDKSSAEASLKYLLFGAVASATMLYGMSLLYAQTLTLDFTNQQFIDALLKAESLPFIVGAVLVLAGILFKIAAVPFHIWSPDVYTTAPTSVVAFFSVVPKLAGLSILIKVVLVLNLFGQSPVNWITILSIIAMVSMLIGNFSALWQNNVKRMLAYSSIAQAGFLIAGLAAFSESALNNVIFYSTVYMLMNMAAFLIVQYFEKKINIVEVKDYSGLINEFPLLSIMLVIIFLSLTGLPPTAGFTAKFLIFSSVWESYNNIDNQWLLYLVLFGLINTAISLFYYLKIPFYMIFRPSSRERIIVKNKLGFENYLGGILVVAILILFFKPDWLMGLINNISFAF